MTPQQVDEIIACLPQGRTLFHYYKDRYAPLLLSHVVGEGKSVRTLKATRFGRLLQKAVVKDMIADRGDGVVRADDLRSLWPGQVEAYRLTLGRWGEIGRYADTWYQTSRPGINLVLQLNFSNRHNADYARMLRIKEDHPFAYDGHPINDAGELTLSWARLDIDLDGENALIEEIQSDWVRNAVECLAAARRYMDEPDHCRRAIGWRFGAEEVPTLHRLTLYVERALAPYRKLWAEATLAAAIWFLREELGVRRIFYHTYDGGARLKHMDGCLPPRSLYTDLPRRFCFALTDEQPFVVKDLPKRIRRAMARRGAVQWFVLEL